MSRLGLGLDFGHCREKKYDSNWRQKRSMQEIQNRNTRRIKTASDSIRGLSRPRYTHPGAETN